MNERLCTVCGKAPGARNSQYKECSHVDCPHRRHCWSERPTGKEHFKGPWPTNPSIDPEPLDKELSK